MILKIVKAGLFILCIIIFFFACKKDKTEILQEEVSGEYEYFRCSSEVQKKVNNRYEDTFVTECDSLTKKILVVSKSDKENYINITFEFFSKDFYLNADGTFKSMINDAFSHGSFYDRGNF